MSPKKSTKSTKYSSSLTKKGTEGLGIFSVTTKYFNKNYSRSQEKIKTIKKHKEKGTFQATNGNLSCCAE